MYSNLQSPTYQCFICNTDCTFNIIQFRIILIVQLLGNILWANGIDLCPDTLYLESK